MTIKEMKNHVSELLEKVEALEKDVFDSSEIISTLTAKITVLAAKSSD